MFVKGGRHCSSRRCAFPLFQPAFHLLPSSLPLAVLLLLLLLLPYWAPPEVIGQIRAMKPAIDARRDEARRAARPARVEDDYRDPKMRARAAGGCTDAERAQLDRALKWSGSVRSKLDSPSCSRG